MTEHRTVSMEESTTGAVSSFLELEACECLQSMKFLAYLAGALQRYEEEGVLLEPRIVFCSSIEDLVKYVPSARYVQIGTEEFRFDSCKRILKQCATLSGGLWNIIAERSDDGKKVNFGIMSYLSSPTSIDLRDMIGLPSPQGAMNFCILVEKIDTKTVLMTGSRGNSLRISFSTTKKTSEENLDLEKFATCCTKSANSSDFTVYFNSLVNRCLTNSHGSILVCRDGLAITKVKGMSDGVILNPSIDLKEAYISFKTFSSADSILDLQRYEQVLLGMMQSDGIVVFDPTGKITAYRVFFKDSSKQARNAKKTIATDGGARRRAFEGLRPLVGTELDCALFRSQDGMMIYEGK